MRLIKMESLNNSTTVSCSVCNSPLDYSGSLLYFCSTCKKSFNSDAVHILTKSLDMYGAENSWVKWELDKLGLKPQI